MPHFDSTVAGVDDPHVRLMEVQHGTQWDWNANGDKVAEPEQFLMSTPPRVTFAPEPQISTLPPCRPPVPNAFSMEKEQLEKFCQSASFCQSSEAEGEAIGTGDA